MKGVLLVNTGSTRSPKIEDVKSYLDEFLMDERVIDIPYFFRAIIVKGIILNTRPKRSAAAYKKIWWKEGSPLLVISERMRTKLQDKMDIPVELSMRYADPSIKMGLTNLRKKGVTEVFVIPLYPQFAMATTESIIVEIEKICNNFFKEMKIESLPPFYDRPEYVEVLSNSIKNHLSDYNYDYLLFSYHGVPERHIRKADITGSHHKIEGNCCDASSPAHKFCYRYQCLKTTANVVEKLKISSNKYSISFQSQLGYGKWLSPKTDITIKELALKGIKKLAVVTPGFVADCLETLEEIDINACQEFKKYGGEEFKTIPCLNYEDEWINLLASWIENWKLK